MVMPSTEPAPWRRVQKRAANERFFSTVGAGGMSNVTFGSSTPHALKAEVVCAARAGVDAPR